MTGWALQRGRPAVRVVALASAVVVTAVAALWLPSIGAGPAAGTAPPEAAPPPDSAAPAEVEVPPVRPTEPAPTPSGGTPSAPPSPATTSPSTATTAANPPPPPAQQPGPAARSNTASLTNLGNGTGVGHCYWVTGRADLASGKTMFLVQRRTSPADPTYYFFYVGDYANGNVPSTWGSPMWFGSAASGHRYDVYLLIMDVAAARTFYTGHSRSNGAYADSSSIPGGASVAARTSVTQTSTREC